MRRAWRHARDYGWTATACGLGRERRRAGSREDLAACATLVAARCSLTGIEYKANRWWGRAHLALAARVSWNSYDQRWPRGPTVRATECENEPEPVPANAKLGLASISDKRDEQKR